MRKRIKITAITAIAMIALMVLLLQLFRYDGFSQTDLAKLELNMIGMVVNKLTAEDKLTPDVWRKINRMDDLAPLVAPQLEQGMQGQNDPWGNLYQLEKRKENGHLIITIRSSKECQRKWYQWKNKVLGIEIIITEQDGKVVQIKDLWRDD
jgi:hypothetical protein